MKVFRLAAVIALADGAGLRAANAENQFDPGNGLQDAGSNRSGGEQQKAYKESLKKIPDAKVPSDPWGTVRSDTPKTPASGKPRTKTGSTANKPENGVRAIRPAWRTGPAGFRNTRRTSASARAVQDPDHAARIGDRARVLHLACDFRHRGAPHPQHFGEKFLRQRDGVAGRRSALCSSQRQNRASIECNALHAAVTRACDSSTSL